MVFYTDRFVPKGSRGCARGFVILIRPQYKDSDRGLLEHEKVHVRQFWTGGMIVHSLRYLLSKQYRFECEVEAYKEQAEWYPDDRRLKFAGFIARNYGLKVTVDAAFEAIKA